MTDDHRPTPLSRLETPRDDLPKSDSVRTSPVRTGTPWTAGQVLTLFALTLGYTGFYLCRVNYSVSKPSLLAEYGSVGVDKAALGAIDSFGTICYALGKIVLGVATDFVSPKVVFLGAMAGSVVATVMFAGLGGARWGMMGSWCLNRLVQSGGWGALTKIASRWFAAEQYGRAMAILALSYFFGDALARLLYGELLSRGMGWRGLYIVGAAMLGVIAIVCAVLIRDHPPTAVKGSSRTVFTSDEDAKGVRELLAPLLSSSMFWIVVIMSAGLTFARESFSAWTPTYLVESAGLSPADAARSSSLFPFFGGISVLLAGWASDRLFAGRRGLVMVIMLLPACGCLLGLALLSGSEGAWVSRGLISGTAIGMLGPYAFLSGAVALDIGSKRGSATAAGLIDAAGYFAGAMAGAPLAKLVQGAGWGVGWGTLAGAVALVTFAAGAYWWRERQ